MNEIKVMCPAKINLDLRVYKKEENQNFHKIKSIMQAISLYDYLTVSIDDGVGITLSGDSDEITYDADNICYKAASAFLAEIKKDYKINIHIQKNIPVAAGLAGGSTDAAGAVFALNKLSDNVLDSKKVNEILENLGSDLNFCYYGGTKLCLDRGQTLVEMPFFNFQLSLVKPKNLKISTAEAYKLFDELKTESNLRNDLEFALTKLGNYPEINYLHDLDMQMSGSGPTFFVRKPKLDFDIDKDKYLVIENLNSVPVGVKLLE